jgi:hypothetical protein
VFIGVNRIAALLEVTRSRVLQLRVSDPRFPPAKVELGERTRVREGYDQAAAAAYAQAEQVVWPEVVESAGGGRDHHGAAALLRDSAVLVVAERVERGRGPSRARILQVGPAFARRRRAQSGDPEAFDLHVATDEDRLAFAQDLGAVIEAFGLTVAAEVGQLRQATTDLVALLVR